MNRSKRTKNGSEIQNGFRRETLDDDGDTRRGAITHRDKVRTGDDSTIVDSREKAKALFLSMGIDTNLYLPPERREREPSNPNMLAHSSTPQNADVVEKSTNGSPSANSSPLPSLRTGGAGTPHSATLQHNGFLDHHDKVYHRPKERREEAQDQVPVPQEQHKDDNNKNER